MKSLFTLMILVATLCVAATSQSSTNGQSNGTAAGTETKAKRVIFRPTKGQIEEVQTLLKAKNLYSGESTGKYNGDTRVAIKLFQKDNGLKQTGILNRATLEKMDIELTDTQKAIPVSPNSYATDKPEGASTAKPKRSPIFRATKDQIREAQQKLKDGGMYSGEQTGQLNPETRDGLKKFQEASSIKVTGTLNQVTLEKMGITLTEKQIADLAASPSEN